MMPRIAVFPGSFDPMTSGHEAIVRRALALFDRIVIAVGVNTDKQYMFTTEERMEKIRSLFADEERVTTVSYNDMTVDLCKRVGAQFILRGIRNAKDLEYEQTIAAVNRTLNPHIDTILLMADDAQRDISSTLIREQMAHQQTD
ncbi:MAG: pantetheine-phosphate adenylyltransferase [Bacteroidales bacterium]|nr:pantetheine-phosphate adenylyltransferase [Bacteroidales bacterium]